jgi:muconolactone delta-isomerase
VEFLVTMTTTVPAGTSDATVADVRSREAARARQLAEEGALLRLWRPPLGPGEWRTIGLFAAGDADGLEQALSSMPLRIWRTDEVTALGPHPNDPSADATTASGRSGTEFLTRLTDATPGGASPDEIEDMSTREAGRARALAGEGHLLRLWSLPAERERTVSLGLWQAADASELDGILRSLPMYPWLYVETTELSPHPNDPGAGAGGRHQRRS